MRCFGVYRKMYKFSGCAFLKLLKLKKAYVKNCAGFPLQTTIQLIFFFEKVLKLL